MADAETASVVDQQQIFEYFALIFGATDFEPTDLIMLRGLGEKGTERESETRLPNPLMPGAGQNLADAAAAAARTWEETRFAAYWIPRVMSRASGEADAVKGANLLKVDIDTGDSEAKLSHLEMHMGTPTMIVASGGTTETGTAKLHAYWILDEMSDELATVEHVERLMALKVGGDPSVARLHQPIRYPGTAYQKDGVRKRCYIRETNPTHFYDLADLAERAEDMPQMDGIEVTEYAGTSLKESFEPIQNIAGMFDLSGGVASEAETSAQREAQQGRLTSALTQDVHEGGVDGVTRWDNFTAVAGWEIHLARQTRQSIDTARQNAYAWMQRHMVPPWPDKRFQKEFDGLLRHDVAEHGPMPAYQTQKTPTITTPDGQETGAGELGLVGWAAHRYGRGNPPPRRWLVDGLLMQGKLHMLVSEGGAGKSLACLELGLKLTVPRHGDVWLERRVNAEEAGTVVILTAEDDADDIFRRMHKLDPDGRRFEALDNLIVVPLINSLGVFPLVNSKTGQSSEQWELVLSQLRAMKQDGHDIKLVVIDTMAATMHGDENAATVVQEYYREVLRLCADDIGAAVIVTHHIRKTTDPIRNAKDMELASRGSNAATSAARAVIGIWHASDYKRRMEAMGMKARRGMMYVGAVVKGNADDLHRDEISLLRNSHTGALEGVTGRDVYTEERKRGGGPRAWLKLAIQTAAADGHPLRASEAAFKEQRAKMHPILANMGQREVWRISQEMVAEGEIVRLTFTPNGAEYLDVPDGACAQQRYEEPLVGVWEHPDWSEDYAIDPENGEIYRKAKI